MIWIIYSTVERETPAKEAPNTTAANIAATGYNGERKEKNEVLEPKK